MFVVNFCGFTRLQVSHFVLKRLEGWRVSKEQKHELIRNIKFDIVINRKKNELGN